MTHFRILFTGAHHNSALATLDWLAQNSTSGKYEFFWVGKKNVPSDSGVLTPEYKEVVKRDVKFFNLNTGKFYRFKSFKFLPRFIWNLLLVPIGFISSVYIIAVTRPHLVVSFGGYIAVPVVMAAKLFGIKSVTHEQTTVIGLANRIIERLVDRIYTAWPVENYKSISSKKLHYVGLPLRKQFLNCHNSPKIKFPDEKPVLYVTGGKLGSVYINSLVLEAVDVIIEYANIIWACGFKSGVADLAAISNKIKENGLEPNMYVKEYFLEDEISSVYNTMDFALSRSGAHTVYELAFLKKYAILAPLMWSSNNEQYENAMILQKIGLAKVVDEDSYGPQDLVYDIKDIVTTKKYLAGKGISGDLVKKDGQETLGHEIIRLLA